MPFEMYAACLHIPFAWPCASHIARRKLDKSYVKKRVLAVKGKTKTGKKTYTGLKGNLKASQTYNGRFSREAGSLRSAGFEYLLYLRDFFQVARNFLLYSERKPSHNVLVDFTPDQWLDARL